VPKKRIPLVGTPNQRNYDSLASLIASKDQRYINGIIGLVSNSFTRSAKAYFEKRPGLETNLTPASGSTGEGVFFSRSQNKFVSAFSTGGVSTLYVGTTNCGSTS
jgi:hypothetical protein